MNYKNQPVIKWTGSKRYLANQIIEYFPKEIDTYYEPFLGGGSVFFSLLNNENYDVKRFILSDINNDLIQLWNKIQKDPKYLIEDYNEMWKLFNSDFTNISETEIIANRKKIFTSIREDFNKTRDPSKFLFLTRTSINGLIRYNKSGNFNAPSHFTRPGMNPEKLVNIINFWSEKINEKNITFINSDYSHITKTNENDAIFLDPPYASSGSMYYGKIEYEPLWKWVHSLNGTKVMSFDGKTDKKEYMYEVPKEIYDKHIFLEKKNSSFNNLNKKETKVQESLYILK